MGHRQKHKHKPRHHSHAVKPASIPKPGLRPLASEAAATPSETPQSVSAATADSKEPVTA